MARTQARRKTRTVRKVARKKSAFNLSGITTLLAGMVIGALATILWQGVQTADSGIGAGIRRLFERPPESTAAPPSKPAVDVGGDARTTPFDFFTVLPGIEVIVPNADTVDAGAYLLQAASYRRRSEAERLKATLALNGMVSAIQKVSIEGKGDFYRIRLGPFESHEAMVEVERQLSRIGIDALRLKVSGEK